MESRRQSTQPGEKRKLYYGTVIVGAAFLTMMIGGGLTYSFSVFFEPLLKEFGWTRAMTSGAFSLFMLVNGLSSIVCGRLNDRFGPRVLLIVLSCIFSLGYILMSQVNSLWQLYIFYGVMIAIGTGNNIPVISTTARWYTRRRGIMTGIVMGGVGIGTMVLPLLSSWLIYHFDWRMSYILLGGIGLVINIILAQLFRRNPPLEGIAAGGSPDMEYVVKASSDGINVSAAMHTRQFWQLCVIMFCNMTCAQAIMVHFVIHAIDMNFTPTNAATLMTVLGAFSFFGRIFMGIVADKAGAKTAMVASCTIVALSLIWLCLTGETWTVYLFAVMFGFAYGGSAALPSVLAGELFGLRAHGVILGIVMFIGTIGGALGPVAAGYIYDINQSYQAAFLAGGIISAAAAVSALLLGPPAAEKTPQV